MAFSLKVQPCPWHQRPRRQCKEDSKVIMTTKQERSNHFPCSVTWGKHKFKLSFKKGFVTWREIYLGRGEHSSFWGNERETDIIKMSSINLSFLNSKLNNLSKNLTFYYTNIEVLITAKNLIYSFSCISLKRKNLLLKSSFCMWLLQLLRAKWLNKKKNHSTLSCLQLLKGFFTFDVEN